MNDLVKGILAGGWSLVAGWILPSAINVLLVGFFVLPSLRDVTMISHLANSGVAERTLAVVVAAIVAGLILNALQVPLYRVLEGYLWPSGIARRRQARYVRLKHLLQDRLEAIHLQVLSNQSRLEKSTDEQKLTKLLADQKSASISNAIKPAQWRNGRCSGSVSGDTQWTMHRSRPPG